MAGLTKLGLESLIEQFKRYYELKQLGEPK